MLDCAGSKVDDQWGDLLLFVATLLGCAFVFSVCCCWYWRSVGMLGFKQLHKNKNIVVVDIVRNVMILL